MISKIEFVFDVAGGSDVLRVSIERIPYVPKMGDFLGSLDTAPPAAIGARFFLNSTPLEGMTHNAEELRIEPYRRRWFRELIKATIHSHTKNPTIEVPAIPWVSLLWNETEEV